MIGWERVACPRGGYLMVSTFEVPMLLKIHWLPIWSWPYTERVGKNISNPENQIKPYVYLYFGPVVFLFLMNRWVRDNGWLYKVGTGNKLYQGK